MSLFHFCSNYLGNLYIANSNNHRIRMVAASTNIITTIAGTGTSSFSGDGGAATLATLYMPTGVALDSLGSVIYLITKTYLYWC